MKQMIFIFLFLFISLLLMGCENSSIDNQSILKTTNFETTQATTFSNTTTNISTINSTQATTASTKTTEKTTSVSSTAQSTTKPPKKPTKDFIEKIYKIKLPDSFKLLKYSYEYDEENNNRPYYPIKISIKNKDKKSFVNNLKNYIKLNDDEMIPNIQFTVDWWDMDKNRVAEAYKKNSIFKYEEPKKDYKKIARINISFDIFIMKSTDENCVIYLCN